MQPSTTAVPSNQDIEAVIQMATSARPAAAAPPRDTRTQLFVGNLPYRVRWQDLKDLFRKAGTVLRADVSLGPDNRSRGYGTVLLGTAEDAGRAIDMFNGYSWQTRILEVRADRMPPEYDINCPFPANNSNQNSTAMSAGNSQIHTPLGVSPFPPPPSLSQHASFTLDPSVDYRLAGVGVGVGGVGMASALSSSSLSNVLTAADLVSNGLSSSMSGGSISISRSASRNAMYDPSAVGGGSGSGSKSIFVGNLPFQCQWQDLKDLFRQVGPVVRADVALGPDGRSRGFGTVLFQSESDADKAVTLFHGYEYNNRALKVHHDKFTQLTTSGLVSYSSVMPTPPSQKVLPPSLQQLQQQQQQSQYPSSSSYMMGGEGGMGMVSNHFPPHQMQMMGYPSFSQPTSPYDQYPPSIPRHVMEQYMTGGGAGVGGNGTGSGSAGGGGRMGSAGLYGARGMASGVLDPAYPVGSGSGRSNATTTATTTASANSGGSPTSNGTHSSSPSSPSTTTTSPQKDNNSNTIANKNPLSTPKTPSQTQRNATASTSPIRSPPGTIVIPPPPTGFTTAGVMFSPLGRGLPPMTPSMPGFQFHPQVSSTPPAFLPHFLSPGLGPNSPPPNMTFFSGGTPGGGG
ncbi:hypothetical protein FRB95_010394, partial [Tulasnella sp. JGI-2019a]